jgi:hypothetical protein
MKKSKVLIYLTISQANKLMTKHSDKIENASIHLDSKTLLNEDSKRLEKFSIWVNHLINENPTKLIHQLTK